MRRACLGLLCLLACEQTPWAPDYSNHPYVPAPPGTYPGSPAVQFPDIIDPALDRELGRPAIQDLVARAAFETFESYCASCHGKGNDQGGFDSVLDMPALIEQGWIVPGSSTSSPLLSRMLDGSMPPDPLSKPNLGDLALIARFIQELGTTASADCAAPEALSMDELLAGVLADVETAPESDRRFLRYVRLTPPAPGDCGAAPRQRWALFKLVNSVSTGPRVVQPVAIGTTGLLYRLDLRDYGWDRALDVEGNGTPNAADGWLALTTYLGPYAPELAGPEADALKRALQTAVPLLPADALVHAASAGEVYYALLGVLPLVADTESVFGVQDALQDEGPAVRAGFFVFRRNELKSSMITGVELPASPGSRYWRIQDDPPWSNQSFLDYPLDPYEYPRLAIFELPNGFPAYLVEGTDGRRATEVPACLGPDCTEAERSSRAARVNSAACQGCHADGLLPARDMLRDWIADPDSRDYYDQNTLTLVSQQYLPPDEFARVLQAQNARWLAALDQAGVPASAPEPISRVYFGFERDPVGAAQAAAEFGVSLPSLLAELGRLDPVLAPLAEANGQIERKALSAALTSARCALLASARNRPAFCP